MADYLGLDYFPERYISKSGHRVNSIVRIVNNNIYSQKLRGEDVAEQLNITTRQLNRICNEYLGCSINRYIIQCRIKGMQALLRESSYTLTDIAEIFGFSDVYAFIKHFSHFTGVRREITAGLLMAIKQKNFPARMRSMKVKKLFIDVRKLHLH